MEKKYSIWYEFLLPIFGVIIFLTGYLVLKYTANTPILYNTIKTPWGIITSMFIFDGDGNVVDYAIYALVFCAANVRYSRFMRVKRYLLSIWVSLLSAVIGNVINLIVYWLSAPNGYSLGQSGIVYGFMGALAFIALFDILFYLSYSYHKRKKEISTFNIKRGGSEKARGLVTCVFTVLLFGITIIFLVVDFPLFFSVAPGVDSFLHFISFLSGFLIASVYIILFGDKLWWLRL